MSSEWQVVSLGDLTDWMSGGTPRKDEPKYWNGDIPWISANSMYGSRYSDSDLKLTQEGLNSGSRLAPSGSVLLLVRGGALHTRIPVGMAMRDVAFNQDVKALVPKTNQLRTWYLLYWLMGMDQYLLSSVVEYTGIGAGKLDTKRMQGLEFLLPPVSEQDAIVGVAKSLDDRITLLRESNTTLESIAQALFKSWFVDFDPVRTKMEGRAPEGMDEATAALFPDSFEESELGLQPKGWLVKRLDEISEVGIGKTPPRKEPEWFSDGSEAVRWVSIRDMGVSGVYIADTAEGLVPEAIDRFNVRRVPDNTVLLSFKLTVGRVSITDGEMTTNEAIAHCKLRQEDPLPTEFIYLYLKQFDFGSLGSTSSIAEAVNSKTIKLIPIIAPSNEVVSAFHSLVGGIFQRLKENERQVKTLTALRDTLLPRLISGQLRLSEFTVD